jgi:MFS family permease
MLIGFAIGSPLGGWLSDLAGRRRPPLLAAAALALAGWLVLLYGPALPLAGTIALLAFIGASSGPMVVCMAAARERSPAAIGGAVTGFINTAMVGGAAVMQPLVGALLDARWTGAMADGARLYSPEAYLGAFVALPASAAVALLAATLARETFARQAPP